LRLDVYTTLEDPRSEVSPSKLDLFCETMFEAATVYSVPGIENVAILETQHIV